MSKKSLVPTQFGWDELGDYTEGEEVDNDEDEEYFNYVEDINDNVYDEDHKESDENAILHPDNIPEEELIEKRQDAEFWAARGKKEDADFWATRG